MTEVIRSRPLSESGKKNYDRIFHNSRKKGSGTIRLRRGKYEVFAPRKGTRPIEMIGKYDRRSQAEAALTAYNGRKTHE